MTYINFDLRLDNLNTIIPAFQHFFQKGKPANPDASTDTTDLMAKTGIDRTQYYAHAAKTQATIVSPHKQEIQQISIERQLQAQGNTW